MRVVLGDLWPLEVTENLQETILIRNVVSDSKQVLAMMKETGIVKSEVKRGEVKRTKTPAGREKEKGTLASGRSGPAYGSRRRTRGGSWKVTFFRQRRPQNSVMSANRHRECRGHCRTCDS